MTNDERIARAERARRAMEEFLAPAFDAAHAEYVGRLKAIAAREPWAADRIAALANAARIVEEVRAQVAALVHDGEKAAADKARAERIERMSPARSRFLRFAPL